MKKLLLIAFTALSLSAQAQLWPQVGNTLQRSQNGFNYRFNMGSPGFFYLYSKAQVDSLYASAIAKGVLSFNGRTGAVTPASGDYSEYYPLLSGSYTNPSWIASLAYGKLTGAPTSLPPSGSAAGDLSGTYPNPIVNTINGITKSYYDPTSSIQTQLNNKQSQFFYNIKDAGAVADASYITGSGTDQTTLVQTLLTFVGNLPQGGTVYVPFTGNSLLYRITSTLTVPSNVSLVMDGAFIYDVAANNGTACLQIGSQTASTTQNTYVLNIVKPINKYSNWTNDNSTAARFINVSASYITIKRSQGFTSGIICEGYSNNNASLGFSYNKGILLGNIVDNRQGVWLLTTDGGTGTNTPFCNENYFIGGAITSSSLGNTVHANLSRYGVRLTSSGSLDNNIFEATDFELGDTQAGTGVAVPVLIDNSAANNYFDGIRTESNSIPYIMIINSGATAHDNVINVGYTSQTFTNTTYQNLGSGINNYVVQKSRVITNASLASNVLFNSYISTTATQGDGGVITLAPTLVSQAANRVFASPNGSAGTPTWRLLQQADLTGNYVDLVSAQTVAGAKNFTSTTSVLNINQVNRAFGSSTTPIFETMYSYGAAASGVTTIEGGNSYSSDNNTFLRVRLNNFSTLNPTTIMYLTPTTAGFGGTVYPLAVGYNLGTQALPFKEAYVNSSAYSTGGFSPLALNSTTKRYETVTVWPIANGGTGSATQNFVDLTTTQTVAGAKTLSNLLTTSAGITNTGTITSTGNIVFGAANTYSVGTGATDNASNIWTAVLRTDAFRSKNGSGMSFKNSGNTIQQMFLLENGHSVFGGVTDNNYWTEVQASGTSGYFKAGNFSVNASGVPILNGTATVGQAWVATSSAGAGAWSSVAINLFANTSPVTVTNTTTESSLIPSGTGSMTVPAAIAGFGQYRLIIGGVYSTPPVTAGTLTIKVKYNGTTIATGIASGFLAGATNLAFDGIVKIVSSSTGVSGTMYTSGGVNYSVANNAARFTLDLNNGGAQTVVNNSAGGLIEVTGTWDTASASKIVTITQFTLEQVR